MQAELGLWRSGGRRRAVRLRRDLQTQKIAFAQQHIKQLTQAVDKARRLEAKRAVAEAQKAEQHADPLLGRLASENMRLAEDLQKVTKPIEVAERELKESGDLWGKLRDQFSKTRDKADGVGLTETIGQPPCCRVCAPRSRRSLEGGVEVNSRAIDETQFKLYELDELRSTLANPDPLIQEILALACRCSLGDADRKAPREGHLRHLGSEATARSIN